MPKPRPLPPPSQCTGTSRADEDDESDLEELPPLDGEPEDADEAPPTERDLGGLLEDAEKEAPANLDDKTGEDDPLDAGELGIGEGEDDGLLDDSADAADLDLGAAAPRASGGADVGPVGEDDRPVDDAGFRTDDDAAFQDGEDVRSDVGEEGPVREDAALSESDLPDLDDDEQGNADDAVPVAAFEDEPSGLPWAAEPWARVGAPWTMAEAIAVACAGRGAIVVGRGETGAFELVRVDLEGASHGVPCSGLEPSRIRALSADGETVVATASDGRVFFSADGGVSFVAADDHASGPPARGAPPGRAAAARVPADAPSAAPAGPVAGRGALVAYAARRGGVVRGGKGQNWASIAWEGRVTELSFIDDAGTLVAATYSDVDDTSALVRVSVGGGPVLVARIGPARSTGESDGRVVAMSYDDSRGVLWVAGGFGLAAFAGR